MNKNPNFDTPTYILMGVVHIQYSYVLSLIVSRHIYSYF
jgi:hypothetical protein